MAGSFPVLRIHHSERPVGNLDYLISCSCGWESVHAGHGAEEDAIAAGSRHLLICELSPPLETDWEDPLDATL
jgi:hypothetical protein